MTPQAHALNAVRQPPHSIYGQPSGRILKNRRILADKLNTIPHPGDTVLTILRNGDDNVVLEWVNLKHQHCITLSVDLAENTADYEYSNVCLLEQELIAFPKKPLGSPNAERMDIKLHRQDTWRWLCARIRATSRPSH